MLYNVKTNLAYFIKDFTILYELLSGPGCFEVAIKKNPKKTQYFNNN